MYLSLVCILSFSLVVMWVCVCVCVCVYVSVCVSVCVSVWMRNRIVVCGWRMMRSVPLENPCYSSERERSLSKGVKCIWPIDRLPVARDPLLLFLLFFCFNLILNFLHFVIEVLPWQTVHLKRHTLVCSALIEGVWCCSGDSEDKRIAYRYIYP